ncbi:two-component sensor histidine kinase [Pseudoclavibacter chungangensis]|uniref:Two-component sensor histidine kinase n=1 Tax=Pseudoclavibacter chungangensis TaxID=587635 RepID=A0A7J5C2P1_9MICO|nr:histidine kinase [Pseudoclavibacter chungangensis]KAB1660323.1 two-component sensor histidine kinase [Pseudoclavibacter chungangensis]NYJ65678.1 two-component system sensor histidine kinase DesK [Pseudoclavibacter chungangensis]
MDRFGMTSARRFEGYVRWSLYILLALPLAPLMPFAAIASFRLRQGDMVGGTIAVSLLLGVSALALVGCNIVVARAGFQRLSEEDSPLPAWLLAAWAAAAVIHLTCAAFLASVDLEVYGRGLTVAAVCAIGTIVSALTPQLSSRQLLVVCAVLTVPIIGYGVFVSAGDAILVALFVWFLSWMAWLTVWMLRVMYELQDAHEVRADLALAEERLRISRDLHDVFGRTLATIAVKSELASELSRRGKQERAGVEMAEVRRLAETAGTEVRRVVRGELRPSWAEELEGARALLDSAGIRCIVSGDDVPPVVAETLAWVVREGVTNILRHSEASTVTIATAAEAHEIVLTLANDGAGAREGGEGGSGIDAMSERLRAMGGALEVRRDGDWFLLEATAPTHTEVSR